MIIVLLFLFLNSHSISLAVDIRQLSSTLLPLKKMLIVGLNPALQRTISIPKLALDDVNRATKVYVGIGGKGTA